MRLPGTHFLRLAAGIAALTLLAISWSAHGSRSEATKTIKVIVPLPAGLTADTLVRLLTEQISRTNGSTMEVENRPGDGQVVGTEAASHAAPDGNTLLFVGPTFAISPHFDPALELLV